MTRKIKLDPGLVGDCGTPDAMRAGLSLPNREMWVQFRFDRESFDALKELLRAQSNYFKPQTDTIRATSAAWEDGGRRLRREALKRVFDQIRDVEYNDK